MNSDVVTRTHTWGKREREREGSCNRYKHAKLSVEYAQSWQKSDVCGTFGAARRRQRRWHPAAVAPQAAENCRCTRNLSLVRAAVTRDMNSDTTNVIEITIRRKRSKTAVVALSLSITITFTLSQCKQSPPMCIRGGSSRSGNRHRTSLHHPFRDIPNNATQSCQHATVTAPSSLRQETAQRVNELLLAADHLVALLDLLHQIFDPFLLDLLLLLPVLDCLL